MKRTTVRFLFCVVALAVVISGSKAQCSPQQADATPLPGKIFYSVSCDTNDITDCPETGCGPSLDPYLNRQKNICSLDGEAKTSGPQMRNLPNPVRRFKIGKESFSQGG